MVAGTSADEVTRLLREWAARLARRDPTAVSYLRPGLTRAQVDATTAEHGIRLPDDAAAVWTWHDGERDGLLDDVPPDRRVFPGGYFLSLRATLEESRTLTSLSGIGPGDDYSEEEYSSERRGRPVQLFFRREFVLLSCAEHATYLDCTDPDVEHTGTACFSTWSDTPTQQVTLAERVAGWNLAWDAGVWPDAPTDWTTVDHQAAERLFGRGPHVDHRLQ
ncbi:MAG: hypothetical protein IR158_00010 [Cellulomonas sp.]|uniref:hypothetical protein n=1 Tax=Cellulomonas sp. TaxID=40001 RepID=UPI0019D99F11|nr:hypothetical protein [Cellulomonas sp.]MBF0686137.1 hypothetical protein [Cellulomonas sp.]